MKQINPYLFFQGNCAEVMTFYSECFNGTLNIQKIKDNPGAAAHMPETMHKKVMHSSMIKDGFAILASDMASQNYVQGNNISLCINMDNKDEAELIFNKLSEGGTAGSPLHAESWGTIYGDLTDKYGIRWMFNVDQPKQ